MLKTNLSEFKSLKKAEMELLAGGDTEQSDIGFCDICHFTKSEKAKKELAENSSVIITDDNDLVLL